MLKMKKEVFTIMFAAIITVLFIGLMPWNSAHALELQDHEFILKNYEAVHVDTFSKDNSILKSAVSSDPSVAVPKIRGALLEIYPKKAGQATIFVEGEVGSPDLLKVTITKDYIKQWLKEETVVGNAVYGSSKLRIISIPGAKGTVTVGKKKYTIKRVGESGKAVVKLKNYAKIKLNTKVILKLKYDGQSVTYRTKMESTTRVVLVNGSKKKIKVLLEDTHKGDKIIVKYKGKTYTKKVTKNYLGNQKLFTFKTKNKVTKNASMSIKVLNKDKKSLFNDKIKLTDGIYPYDEAEDDDEEEDE